VIGEWIHQHNIDTLVPYSSSCTSACPFIWVAGIHREVHGAIGLHHPYTLTFQPMAAADVRWYRQYWLQMNGPAAVFDKGMETPMIRMAMFSPEELTGAPGAPEPAVSARVALGVSPGLQPPAPVQVTPVETVIYKTSEAMPGIIRPVSSIDPKPVPHPLATVRKKKLEAHERQKAN
jgi:hypothetical protein